uniref:ATP synthase subunit a n=1 Tax=Cyanoptyche gloeocystis TaxID=77922 RepID=A0A096Y6V4_9EUKA|nr:ATP synthase F0 subunit a [Cyanoptyche gloeocystis]AIM52066.1 ATP synthase F0 subunit a [Cyanoptyche gloeocystis]
MLNFYNNSPLEQFKIKKVFNLGTPFFDISITNSAIFIFLAVGFVLTLFVVSLYKSYIIPQKWQSIAELCYEFIYNNFVMEIIGKRGDNLFPLILTLFFFIFSCNLIGMVPYTFTPTSHIIITFSLSMTFFLGFTLNGIRLHGFKFFNLFIPHGAPLVLVPFLIVFEIISYVVRVFSLAIRLFANLTAGHSLTKILAGFAWQMLLYGGTVTLLSIIPIAIIFAVVILELGVAFLQAYVFTVLTCIYIKDTIYLH